MNDESNVIDRPEEMTDADSNRGISSFLFKWPFFVLLAVALSALAGIKVVGPLILLVLGFVVPICVVLGVIFANGEYRLFAIGTILPTIHLFAVSIAIFIVGTFDSWDHFDRITGAGASVPLLLAFIPLCGLLAVSGRRLGEKYLTKWFPVLSESSGTRFQFSLGTMIIGTTACALICLIMFGMDRAVAAAVMLLFLHLCSLFIFVSAYLAFAEGQLLREWRVFLIGAAVPAILMFAIVIAMFLVSTFESWGRSMGQPEFAQGIKVNGAILAVLTLVCGQSAVWIHRKVTVKQETSTKAPDDCSLESHPR